MKKRDILKICALSLVSIIASCIIGTIWNWEQWLICSKIAGTSLIFYFAICIIIDIV